MTEQFLCDLHIRFPTSRFRLAANDSVLLMTDGVAEAQNAEGQLFGFERIGNPRAALASAPVAAQPDDTLAGWRREARMDARIWVEMSSGTHIDFRPAPLAHEERSDEEREALRRHLDDLIQGPAFKGSHRSQQFLRFVVERVLDQVVDQLKERTIGIELFHRVPTYDTGEDAIVRVTASDVRRRLLQHYGRYGDASQFRIRLQPGSYIPEIENLSLAAPASSEVSSPRPTAVLAEQEPKVDSASVPQRNRRPMRVFGVAAAAVLMAAAAVVISRKPAADTGSLLPWSAVFRPGHAVQLITSDPNIEQLEELTGTNISVSDYANQHYVSDPDALSPLQKTFYLFYRHADNAASVDTPLAFSIGRLAPASARILVRSARSLRITDLETDDGLILIGSPRSNPWVHIFQSQLDFQFVFSKETDQEIIRNVRPRRGEQAAYVPTARGFATGESFAILALVHNPNQSGQVLLLAGANGEGTEAAGHTVSDREHLLAALGFCGISTRTRAQDFELLLRLHTMAGSPNTVEMAACHLLPGPGH